LSVYAAYLCFGLCAISLSALGRPTLAATCASLLGAAAAWLAALPFGPNRPLLGLVAGSGGGVLVTLMVLALLDRGDASGYRAQLTAAVRSLRKRQA
jgi:hypothetical protein